MSRVLPALVEQTMKWRENPRLYCSQVLGVQKIWRLQDDVLKAVPKAIKENKPIYVASGHSLGKDFIFSGCISNWFLDCYVPSKVILTGPSDRQVKHIQWAECLARWENKKIKMWGKAFREPYIEIKQGEHYLLGFATKDTGAAADAGGGKFQGIRSAHAMCVIITEAQAVEDIVYDQIDGASTAEHVLKIVIGNPTRAKGRFAKGLKDKENNMVFHFSCLDNPNYKHRKIMVPGLATYSWVEDKRRKWGENDPRWIGRVIGQVPDNAMSNVFPESWINHCRERCGFLSPYSVSAGVAVDSAGEGIDDNVIMSGKGGEVQDVYTKTLMTPTEVAIKAVQMCHAINGQFIVFDCDGVGIRDYQEAANLPDDFLRGVNLIKFHGSAPSTYKIKLPDGREKVVYGNLRAEASFITKDRGLAGKCSIEEKDKELIDDLMEEEYFENEKNGLVYIEAKEDIKERLERSPGRGDAYKMLQWGFSRNFELKPYKDTTANKLPEHGIHNEDIDIISRPLINRHHLPSYGKVE